MLLTSEEIKRAVELREIIINPFNEGLLKASSYSFTLGNSFKKLKPIEFIDSRVKEQQFEIYEIGNDGYLLQPGEFIICHTNEQFMLSKNIACFLSMRGARAQTGLDALQCEIFCEPGSEGGWDGKLMLETSNKGPYPIKLFPDIIIIKGVFFKINHDS